ncbi:MAG: ABC transporter substrate-binding protein [Bacteroidia bacterium]
MQLKVLTAMIFFSTFSFAQKRSVNVSMVLPFCSKQIIANPNCYNAQLGNLCREYYQGALLALDSFERARVSIHLTVFDTENDSFALLKIIQKPIFKESELIFGPVTLNHNKVVSSFAKEKGIFHISPLMTFTKTKLADSNFICIHPDIMMYAKFIFDYIRSISKDTANIIVVSDKSSFDHNFTAAFKPLFPTVKTVKVKYLEYEKNIDIIKYLSLNTGNHIIIPSSHEVNVVNVLKSIKDTDDTFLMTTYGFPHWFEFKDPDYNIWQRMNTTIITPYFVDYDNEQVKKFVMAYREKFYTEPSEAAFEGYDQMLLLGNENAKNGKQMMMQMENKMFHGLSSDYIFKRQPEGNWQNFYLNAVKLDDMKMKKVEDK